MRTAPMCLLTTPLEYPRLPADTATRDEAALAVSDAKMLISAADALLNQVSIFEASR